MRQKELNEKQKKLVNDLKAMIDRAVECGIGFVCDYEDDSLSVYNSNGICLSFDEGEDFDWDKAEYIGRPFTINTDYDRLKFVCD